MFKIEFTRASAKELEVLYRFDKKLYERILTVIQSLQSNPYQGKKLKGIFKDDYALRVGHYRIIYSLIKDKLIVIIIDIGHRKEIYRRI